MKTFCGDYAKMKLIKENEHVQTYTAINSITNKKTILKFFNVEYDKENLQNNIEILKEMNNTNFINIENSGNYNKKDKTGYYIEVEYFESETLRERMKVKKFSLVESMKIVKSIAEGLKEFHFKGLVFKDLSCDNIYIDNNDKVKLDILPYLYRNNSQENEENLREQYDIYCLGVILFQLITNKMDFKVEKVKYSVEDKHLLLIINKCINNQYTEYEDLNFFIEDLNNYIEKCSKIELSTKDSSNAEEDENTIVNPYKFQPLKLLNSLCICGLVFIMITTVLKGNALFKIGKSEVSSNKSNITTPVKHSKQVAKDTKKDSKKDAEQENKESKTEEIKTEVAAEESKEDYDIKESDYNIDNNYDTDTD